MAKGEMHAAMVGLVVSALIVFFASFEVDRRSHDDGPVDERLERSDGAAAPKQEPALDSDLDSADVFESEALMDSLSPGVRTRLEGMIREKSK